MKPAHPQPRTHFIPDRVQMRGLQQAIQLQAKCNRPHEKRTSNRTRYTADQGRRHTAMIERRVKHVGKMGGLTHFGRPSAVHQHGAARELSHRTIEAIKGEKHRPDYKAAVPRDPIHPPGWTHHIRQTTWEDITQDPPHPRTNF